MASHPIILSKRNRGWLCVKPTDCFSLTWASIVPVANGLPGLQLFQPEVDPSRSHRHQLHIIGLSVGLRVLLEHFPRQLTQVPIH